MPLAGIRCRLTAMLIALWMPKSINSPAAAKRQNGSSLRVALKRPRNTMKAKIVNEQQAGHDAEFLAGHGEDEIRMSVGQNALDRAFARPFAEPAAGRKLSSAVSTWNVSVMPPPLPGSMNFRIRARTCGTNL